MVRVITYTLLAAVVLMAVFIVGVAVLKTQLFSSGKFWIAYAIVVFFQLLSNGYLTSQEIVTYNPDAISGTRIAFAPIEDLFFGFALVTLTMFIWERIGPTKSGKTDHSETKG
jgi:lycopene cyclase domain-containing protein